MRIQLVSIAGGLCVFACMGSAAKSADEGTASAESLSTPTESSAESTAAPAPQTGASAQDSKPAPDPWARQVFFGEQHLHTANSPDAFAMGTRNTVDDAYDFAKGKAVKKTITGEMVQKGTPYDWCAVTDHAEYLGMMPLLLDKSSPIADSEIGKLIADGKGEAAFKLIIDSAAVNVPIPYLNDPELLRQNWAKHVETTDKHYEPGKFTTLAAFEWSSLPNSQNLHHNVFFRGSVPSARHGA